MRTLGVTILLAATATAATADTSVPSGSEVAAALTGVVTLHDLYTDLPRVSIQLEVVNHSDRACLVDRFEVPLPDSLRSLWGPRAAQSLLARSLPIPLRVPPHGRASFAGGNAMMWMAGEQSFQPKLHYRCQ
jgi:hypothetical protein